jgi:hypothetical protein
MEHDFRGQLEEFKGFDPQVRKIYALEKRMNAGRDKVQALGDRLDAVRKEIEGWERREGEWQARVSRRLRILWTVMGTTMVIFVITYVVQNWPVPATTDGLSRIELLAQQSLNAVDTSQSSHESHDMTRIPYLTGMDEEEDHSGIEALLKFPLQAKTTTEGSDFRRPPSDSQTDTGDTSERDDDHLRLFDEL